MISIAFAGLALGRSAMTRKLNLCRQQVTLGGQRMLRIDLKRLGKNREAAFDYLRSHLAESPKLKGDRVELETTKTRDAKIILHKFLHHAELENYRVAVINSGLIEIHEIEVREQRPVAKGRGAAPSTWETVPGQSWNKPSGFSRPGKKSKEIDL